MKKLVLTFLVIFTVTVTYAASGINKVKKSTYLLNKSNANSKLFDGICLEVWVNFGECPDGSSYLSGLAVFQVDCNTNGTVALLLDYTTTIGEACEEQVPNEY